MIQILYNSKNACFKKPFGAVKTCESVRFTIYICGDEAIYDVRLIFRCDRNNSNNVISMQLKKKVKNYFIYTAETKFEKADLYFYRFEIETDFGIRYAGLKNESASVGEWLPEWQLTVYDKSFRTPRRFSGSIMYQIFPDRFRKKGDAVFPARNERIMHKNWDETPDFIYKNKCYKANDYFGGNIAGVLEMTEYLKELGVDVVYFNPIFESAEYHRYSTGDYFKVDPYFGTNSEFQNLCRVFKDNNISVILDGVFSHTGADSIYFNKFNHYDSIGAYNSENSPYFTWYSFNKYPKEYESWWGFENLPNVNEEDASYLDFITGESGVIKYWQELGAGGWRLDVADELPDKFLDALYASSKAFDADALIIGEVWEDASTKFAYGKRRRYLLGGQMDSVMNYPWRNAILDYVQSGDSKFFLKKIYSILEYYPFPAVSCLMNSISTHDTPRAITLLGVNHDVLPEEQGAYKMTVSEYQSGKQKMLEATFLQFTLPGIPCIYYGDEVGLDGFRDPYCRKTYPFGKEDYEILSFYKKLSEVRKINRMAFSSAFQLLKTSHGFIMFKRGGLIFAINVGGEKKFLLNKSFPVLFSYGMHEENEGGMYLLPHSMIIICLSD